MKPLALALVILAALTASGCIVTMNEQTFDCTMTDHGIACEPVVGVAWRE